jgi:hypothetical protein
MARPSGGQVVADEQITVDAHAGHQLLELKREETAVDAQLDLITADLVLDAQHHLQPLQHAGRVADGDEVLDLEGEQCVRHLVEPGLVALQRVKAWLARDSTAAEPSTTNRLPPM